MRSLHGKVARNAWLRKADWHGACGVAEGKGTTGRRERKARSVPRAMRPTQVWYAHMRAMSARRSDDARRWCLPVSRRGHRAEAGPRRGKDTSRRWACALCCRATPFSCFSFFLGWGAVPYGRAGRQDGGEFSVGVWCGPPRKRGTQENGGAWQHARGPPHGAPAHRRVSISVCRRLVATVACTTTPCRRFLATTPRCTTPPCVEAALRALRLRVQAATKRLCRASWLCNRRATTKRLCSCSVLRVVAVLPRGSASWL